MFQTTGENFSRQHLSDCRRKGKKKCESKKSFLIKNIRVIASPTSEVVMVRHGGD